MMASFFYQNTMSKNRKLPSGVPDVIGSSLASKYLNTLFKPMIRGTLPSKIRSILYDLARNVNFIPCKFSSKFDPKAYKSK